MEYKNGQENLFYTFSDYQGNLLSVTNTSGTVQERYAYDPWGARRNPTDWTQPDTRSSLLFSRGYTLHEHLDDFGLINMNGRVYDPLMAQFFSPDPYIQSPENWYNYNRYAYGFNNPLLYNDPSGYFFKKFGRWLQKSFDNLGDWMVKHNISVGFGANMTPGGGPMTYTADINGQQVFNSANGNQYDPAVNVQKGMSDGRLSQVIVDGNVAANGGGGYWDDGVSLSISGAYASPFKATGSRGFSFGYFRGAEDGGFYVTAKKGKGVMMSLSLDGSYYLNNTSSNLQVKHVFGHGEEWDVGYQSVGGAFSAGTSLHGTPYYGITGSYSPGLDYGGAEWNTYTVPILIKGTGGIYPLLNYLMIKNAFQMTY